ncbi:exosortase K [Roseivirga sp. BDSF3-8]|uniref:exosortase K n=1 Tax=Roseivirga sp. BDSF3-8 TaxID=3241598 RepID=UPI003531B569
MKNALTRPRMFGFGVATLIFLGLKLLFRQADTAFFQFLLAPVNFLVCLLSDSNSVYMPEQGYYHAFYGFMIDKSCSGYNLMLLCYLMLTYLLLRYTKRAHWVLTAVPITLALAYVFTILVNASRILMSMTFEPAMVRRVALDEVILHEGMGIATHITFLVLLYIISETFLRRKNLHAQSV